MAFIKTADAKFLGNIDNISDWQHKMHNNIKIASDLQVPDNINLNENRKVIISFDTIGEGLPIFYNMYLSVEMSATQCSQPRKLSEIYRDQRIVKSNEIHRKGQGYNCSYGTFRQCFPY